MKAMLGMKRLDVAALRAAADGAWRRTSRRRCVGGRDADDHKMAARVGIGR
jgi:hypothetical protein